MPADTTAGRLPGFFYRFAHPALAVVSTVGSLFWLVGFALAGAGVALRASDPATAYPLFFYGSIASLVGIAAIGAVVGYLVVLWLLRDVLGVLDREKPEPGARR
ncbi:hypothetical protein [Halarchaeum nitratireducens]|uniref:Uncharacterized protein n=1 Tax=Halarchaeum nitratireducens TaxID=489913 RepID=A0A830GBD9_9EURY|nr:MULTISPECIES: hypothetical protein [Halarchaeum]MBP2250539.1 CHASE2 domain-containing sensor protein [Halarchaeum solikamskense]GGN15184.1 hypothetical protein GCM10009021_14340 [Halarchaeum nitratireducens]